MVGFLKTKEKKVKEETGIIIGEIPSNAEIIEEYWVNKPYAKVVIAKTSGASEYTYFVDEIKLNDIERKTYEKIREILEKELDPRKIGSEEDIRKAIIDFAERIYNKYKKAFKGIDDTSWNKIVYYLERDMLGFGPLNVIMHDYEIEDISCDGIGRPIFVWHRKYESIATNITFIKREELDSYIINLTHKAGKHISSAFPIVDAMLYGKHRLAATFREEVSPKGSTFTIRKFREEPFSIIDLIDNRTISPEIAAYFWLLLEYRNSIIVIGGTGSGKTTLLNALACLIKPGLKFVTVEETAELNFPHENWVQFISRESYGISGLKTGEISLYELVKTSLRYRPDYLIVGEIRGEEAFVLFQALATGHGGMSTLHAESLEYAIKRLTSKPMNVAEVYIPLMNCVALVERVSIPSHEEKELRFVRKVRNIWEIKSFNEYIKICEWDPVNDEFIYNFEKSYLFDKISLKTGKSKRELLEELYLRSEIINWMYDKNIRLVSEVANIIKRFYFNKEEILKEIKVPLAREEEKPIPLPILDEELKEPIIDIINKLSLLGGKAEIETLIRGTALDRIVFWRCIDALKKIGYIKHAGQWITLTISSSAISE
jgi:flagellar protein FlaI